MLAYVHFLLYLRGHRPRYARPPRSYGRAMQHILQRRSPVLKNTASPYESAPLHTLM